MEILVGVLLFVFIGVIIMVNVFYRAAKTDKKPPLMVLPYLGKQTHDQYFEEAILDVYQHLQKSYPEHYKERVKERIIREQHITIEDFENRWFEWERYLVMNALLPSVPMYSREVDLIWHEKLMFTREYEQFSKRFFTMMLHHKPHSLKEQKLVPEQRAWFDLVYLLLFEPTKYSLATWGPFLKHPVSQRLIHDFRGLSDEQLQQKYLNVQVAKNVPDVDKLGIELIHLIQERIEWVDNHYVKYGKEISRFKAHWPLKTYLNQLVGILFLSAYHNDNFYKMYGLLYKKKDYDGPDSGDSDSGSNDGNDDNSSDSSSNDSGSSDSGGSSCGSSCGGGCSS